MLHPLPAGLRAARHETYRRAYAAARHETYRRAYAAPLASPLHDAAFYSKSPSRRY